MRKPPVLAAFGVVAAVMVGLTGFAVAQNHARTQPIPVRHSVTVSTRATPVVLASPVAAPFDWSSPFALMDQISARVGSDSDALMRRIDTLAMPGVGVAGFGVPGFTQGAAFASSLSAKSAQPSKAPPAKAAAKTSA
jgi:hypothetical protein